ncbi:hypothetical protein HU745_08840 [Pseudomonas mosselii]|uniref:hypothetical protein n=1 Tax=Pseudomonas mosselii TaxID=78327 RepID=UPI001648D841|nr:hypothetical protein [Pseudomonas mosselii]MBC3451158.1 hypothetical protein [Pseudomonas mosselii]
MDIKEIVSKLNEAVGDNLLPYPIADKIIGIVRKGGENVREEVMLALLEFSKEVLDGKEKVREVLKGLKP